MEEVAHKLKREVLHRVDKRTRPSHPAWQVRVDITNVMRQLTLPTKEQLREDAEWKK